MTVTYSFGLGIGLTALLVIVILHWLQIPAGSLLDWFVGIASFYWLLAIVTIPWNIFFAAQEVLTEAQISREQGITMSEPQLQFAQRVKRWGLGVAISLHILSALGLYLLATSGISPVGYVAAAATLGLTLLRPGVRTYAYLALRLGLIQEQLRYPRADVLELRQRIGQIETQLEELSRQWDAQNPESIVAQHQREWQDLRQRFAQFKTTTEEQLVQQHQDASKAIAQLNEDSQFLLHARELIRFFKTA
ncbi:MAG: hypothetical protein RLZZ435_2905 [Cyanobacteriota bacterium]